MQAASWDPAVRVPNANELQYLYYTTLAYGGKGISDYVYSALGHQGGMVQPDGITPTPLYGAAVWLNPQFATVAGQLQSMTRAGTYHLGDLPWGFDTSDGSSPQRLPGNSPFISLRGSPTPTT